MNDSGNELAGSERVQRAMRLTSSLAIWRLVVTTVPLAPVAVLVASGNREPMVLGIAAGGGFLLALVGSRWVKHRATSGSTTSHTAPSRRSTAPSRSRRSPSRPRPMPSRVLKNSAGGHERDPSPLAALLVAEIRTGFGAPRALPAARLASDGIHRSSSAPC